MENIALLIIDMQNDVLERMVKSGKEIVPNIKNVLNACRQKNIPVIHIVRVHRPEGIDVELFRQKLFSEKPFLVKGSKGAEIIEEIKAVKGEYIVEKQRFSAFFQTELLILLNRLNIKTLALCGVQTPNCIRSTAIDGISYDYNVILLDDATTANTRDVHNANITDMKSMGVKVMKTSELIEILK